MTIIETKHICDRCGNFVQLPREIYPKDWQNISLGQTGANIDLCENCNKLLYKFLSDEGALNMDKACFNDRNIL